MQRTRGGRAAPAWITITGLLLACLPALAEATQTAEVREIDGLRVVVLSGSPYELGWQHGTALREDVRASVSRVLGYFRQYLKVPLVRTWLVNWWLESAWRQANPFLTPEIREELRGLSDASGVPLRELKRLHAIPDRTYSCSSFAAWGRATSGGRLIHVRNLDWNIQAGIQQYATVFVVRPAGKHAFLNVGWAGFIGVLSGVNDAQVSVGQIGAETTDATFRGEPMAFVMRRVLETADDVDEAAVLVQTARRTIGANYVFADAKAKRAVVVESTHRHAAVFSADDPVERRVAYARPLVDVVLRADTAVDPEIRQHQLASGGHPELPGLEPPSGSAYEVRYLGQAAGVQAHYGQLDAEHAIAIARAVAPSSNVQSVVFAWPDVWVANAEARTPAAQRPYHHLNAAELLGGRP